MNEQNKDLQVQVLREQIRLWGVTARWMRAGGPTIQIDGLLSLHGSGTEASSGKRSGRVSLEEASGVFLVETDLIPGAHGDRLLIDGEVFLVLPFKGRWSNPAQTSIPILRDNNGQSRQRPDISY